jgi:hypothetical protein
MDSLKEFSDRFDEAQVFALAIKVGIGPVECILTKSPKNFWM